MNGGNVRRKLPEISQKMKPGEIIEAAKTIKGLYAGHRDERKVNDALTPIMLGASHLKDAGGGKSVEEHETFGSEHNREIAKVLIKAINSFNKRE